MKQCNFSKLHFFSDFSLQWIFGWLSVGSSLGMNYCSVFCDVWHVWSSVIGQNVLFGSVQSSVHLSCDQTSLGTYSLMFVNSFVFCDVWHVQSSNLDQNVMFGKFNVRTFNVWSVWSSAFWCSFQDYMQARIVKKAKKVFDMS